MVTQNNSIKLKKVLIKNKILVTPTFHKKLFDRHVQSQQIVSQDIRYGNLMVK